MKPALGGFSDSDRIEDAEKSKGVYSSVATLEPAALQDFVDALPEVIKAAAGVSLGLQLRISIGDGGPVKPETLNAINAVLESVSSDLKVKL